MENNQFHYYAFISYKREDEKWAKWLQRKIEGFRLPVQLCKENPHLPKKLKVFKDTTDITPGNLQKELENNLQQHMSPYQYRQLCLTGHAYRYNSR